MRRWVTYCPSLSIGICNYLEQAGQTAYELVGPQVREIKSGHVPSAGHGFDESVAMETSKMLLAFVATFLPP